LTGLTQATYYGGAGNETATSSLAIHPTSGEISFGGFMQATSLPGTSGGAQPANAGRTTGSRPSASGGDMSIYDGQATGTVHLVVDLVGDVE